MMGFSISLRFNSWDITSDFTFRHLMMMKERRRASKTRMTKERRRASQTRMANRKWATFSFTMIYILNNTSKYYEKSAEKKCWMNDGIFNFIAIYVMRYHNKWLYFQTPDDDERKEDEGQQDKDDKRKEEGQPDKDDKQKVSDIFIYNVIHFKLYIEILWKKCWEQMHHIIK